MPHNSSSVSCLYALLSYLHLLYIPSFKYIYPPLNRLKDREAVDQAKQLVTTLQSEHTVAMKTLQTTTENEINSLKKGHDNEILSLKQAHEEALRTLVRSHEQSIASLKDNHDKSLASLTRGTMTQIPCPSPLCPYIPLSCLSLLRPLRPYRTVAGSAKRTRGCQSTSAAIARQGLC